ncbi:hypothetical protein SESBI_46909 [Sesbania bispinosa]|nr:hypothetical protein SESBI_46909 [Sesbania bispinosa]
MGLIDQAAMDVFFFYETQGLNPVMAILADTLMSMEVCHKKDGGQLRCCNHLLYVWIITHLYAYDRLGYSPDPFQKFHLIDVKEQSAKQWRDDFARYEAKFFPWVCPWQLKWSQVVPRKEVLEGICFQYGMDSDQQERVRRAWDNVYKKGEKELGRAHVVVSPEYLEWRNRRRAHAILIPFEVHHKEVPSSALADMATQMEMMKAQMRQIEEREGRAMIEIEILQDQCEKKDKEIEIQRNRCADANKKLAKRARSGKEKEIENLSAELKKLKIERDQLWYEIERLEPVEDEKYKWKVRVEHDHEKREEMMKSYEKMIDIVQTHATNLATRVYEANEEIDSSPGMKLPWKIFKLVSNGLPPNYTPLVAVEPSDNNPQAATVNQQNSGPPLESNQAAREASQTQPTTPPLMPYHFPPNYIPPQNNNPEANQAFGSQNTTSQQTIFINSQGESQRPHATLASKEIHQSQNPATEDSQSKEKLQILEERLRVIEGGSHYVFGHHLIKKISNVKTPMKVIFEELCEFGGIKGLTETERSNDKEMKCGFHCSDEHSIEECDEFKQILQSMMDAHLIQISCESEGREVSMIKESAVPRKQECTDVEPVVSTLPTKEQTTSMPKPLDIHYVKSTPSPAPCGIRPLTIRIPTPFPYKSTKAVPWKYDVQALARDAIINISGIGGITRSGRIYTPEKLQGEQSKEVSFRSAGLLFSDQVATVGDRNDIDVDQDTKWVIPCFPETELTN